MRDQERPEKAEIEAQLKAEGAAPWSAEFLRLAELANELMIRCLAACAPDGTPGIGRRGWRNDS